MSHFEPEEFVPKTGCYYKVAVSEREEPLTLEFTKEPVKPEEESANPDVNAHECWVMPDEIRFVYYASRNGEHIMQMKDKNYFPDPSRSETDSTEYYVESIEKIKNSASL